MGEIRNNPGTYAVFKNLREESQEEFIEFCMGVRGMKMTYDTFFKYIFDAEVHPERLESLLSEIIGRPLKIMRELRKEGRRITEEASLVIMDLIVEFDTGEVADVEIQKFGYLFPGERASCYASDLMMRQYEREKNLRGDKFNYRDLKKVYTIVIMENSSKEFKMCPDSYIHRGEWKFDTNLRLNLLQEFYFIPLDIFLELEDNKDNEVLGKELEAWLYFIGSDRPEHICKVIQSFPKFEEIYRDIEYFRYHPKEAVGMFSEALRIMDENTVKYMIDEQAQTIKELTQRIDEQAQRIDEQAQRIDEQAQTINEQAQIIREQADQIEERDKRIK